MSKAITGIEENTHAEFHKLKYNAKMKNADETLQWLIKLGIRALSEEA